MNPFIENLAWLQKIASAGSITLFLGVLIKIISQISGSFHWHLFLAHPRHIPSIPIVSPIILSLCPPWSVLFSSLPSLPLSPSSTSTNHVYYISSSQWESCVNTSPTCYLALLGLWIAAWLFTLKLVFTYKWVHTMFVFLDLDYLTGDVFCCSIYLPANFMMSLFLIADSQLIV